MNITFEQLPQHLTKNLAPIYFVSGDEILLLQEACYMIREAAANQGLNERISLEIRKGFTWTAFLSNTKNLSLFSERKLIEIRLDNAKIDLAGTKIIEEYINHPAEDNVLLILAPKLDSSAQKIKWLKKIEEKYVFIKIWPIDIKYLPSWIGRRLRQNGLNANSEACNLLAEKVEGNLLAAAQEIEKLVLLYGPGKIDAQQILETVANNARYNIFGLKDNALMGQAKKTIDMLENLNTESTEPVLVLWALAKEIRSLLNIKNAMEKGISLEKACQNQKIFPKQKSLIKNALERHSLSDLTKMLQDAAKIDRQIKGVESGNVWQELTKLSLVLSGKKINDDCS
jgi:DNA polymerase III subunit delta